MFYEDAYRQSFENQVTVGVLVWCLKNPFGIPDSPEIQRKMGAVYYKKI